MPAWLLICGTSGMVPQENLERRKLYATCRHGSAIDDNSHPGNSDGNIVGTVDLQLLQELENKARLSMRMKTVCE